MSEIVIYGMHASPFVRKALIAAAEKGIDAELEETSPFAPPDWFLEVNPARRIPVMRDRSVGTEGAEGTLPDSSAICAYLEKKKPDPALYPADPFASGRAVWLEEFADTELAGIVGLHIFRPIFFSLFSGKDPDVETARKGLSEHLPAKLDYLETQIAGQEFFVGDAFSIADISVAVQLQNLELAGGRIDDARWPELGDFHRRTTARSTIDPLFDTARASLPAHDIEL